MPGFGGEVKLTGEEAYRRSLDQITQSLKENGQALKSVADQYAKSDKSVTATAAAQKALEQQLEKQKATLDKARQAYGQYAAELESQKVKHQALTKEYKDAVKELEAVRKSSGETSDAYKAQAEKVEQLKQQLANSNTQMAESKATLKQYKGAMNEAEKAVKDTEAQIENLDKGMDDVDDSTKKAGQSARDAANGGFTVLKGAIADLTSKVIQKAVEGFKNLAKQVAETGIEFDSSMSKVAAVSGASASEIEQLTKKAQEMGSTTKFTASESAEAFNYMAMAGWKTADMLDGIEGIMNLAAASGADLATTSDIVTDALTALGYSAKDAGRLADVMAAASSNANTNVEMMGETFKYAASVAGSLGYSMEDVAIATGLMANAGIKAEQAGTSLRSIMQRLATNTGGARDAVKGLGVEITNADGTMRPLSTVIGELRTSLGKLTDEQKTATAKTIAGTTAMAGLLAIVNASDDDFNKLTAAVNGSSGAADKMAKTMLNNVGGKMTLLKSQLEGIQLTIWKKLEPSVVKCINSISKTLSNINWEKAGRQAAKAFENVTDVFVWIIENWQTVVTGIKAIIAAFVANKIATFATSMISAVTAIGSAVAGATSLSGAFAALNTVMMANPIGLVVGALAGLAVVLGSVISSTNTANEAHEEQMAVLEEQRAQIEANSQAWDDLKKAQKESLNADLTQIENAAVLSRELRNITDENGKVKAGYEGRAKVILGVLNEALGTEYTMTDNIINKYSELRDGIDQLIEKKKAEAVLNSQYKLYEEAITKEAEATRKLTELQDQQAISQQNLTTLKNYYAELQKKNTGEMDLFETIAHNQELQRTWERITAKEEEVNSLNSQLQTQQGLVDEYYFNIGQYEQNAALMHQGAYDQMTNTTFEYVESFQNSADQQKAILQAQIDDTNTKLGILHQKYVVEGNQTYKTMYENALREQNLNYQKMNNYIATTQEGLADANAIWSDQLDDQLSEITGQKVEFKDAGDGLMQMYVDGQKAGMPKSKDEIVKLMNDSIQKMRNDEPKWKTAGGDLIAGVNGGIINKQGTTFSLIQSYGTKLLANLKASLKEKSPSKATREMGSFLLEGINLGIKDEQRETLQAARSFGESVIDSMSAGLKTGIDTSAIAAVRNAIPEEIDSNIKFAAAAAAQAETTNPLVGALKQALSEMKIEMDGEEMGQFVDKTMTKLLYN